MPSEPSEMETANILRCINFVHRPELTAFQGKWAYDARAELDALTSEVARLRRWIQFRVENNNGAELMVAVLADDGLIDTMPWWEAAANGGKCP